MENSTSICKIKCSLCQKEFKTNRGLSKHNNTIRKLNELSKEQEKIPDLIVTKIKNDIVYLIHRRLDKNSKNTRLQAVSLTFSKCIFRGSTRYQELSKILNNTNWGIKYYSQNQKTYVQLVSPHNLSQEQHPLIQCAQEKATNITIKNLKKQVRKPNYPCGDVIIEWRKKKECDAKKNICQAGFIYIHFFMAKKYFQN
ncbi:8702_t:CDS:2 [Racocetra fulgida]|uniref:8701_t:CDS:1 n=1 Tax=Racocetra fulgida TaxID=60492 RepID=A0A9N9G119_9GLOM|nr:8701_t:CDS:2 [Racocetra fulgida]CAG8571925.1 8702_t:CDS:2 [Racocetra fulgida]